MTKQVTIRQLMVSAEKLKAAGMGDMAKAVHAEIERRKIIKAAEDKAKNGPFTPDGIVGVPYTTKTGKQTYLIGSKSRKLTAREWYNFLKNPETVAKTLALAEQYLNQGDDQEDVQEAG